MDTQTTQEHWVDTAAECKSSTQIMAQTRLNKRTQAAQLIINSVFFMVTAAETGVVKNKSMETLSGPQILGRSSARFQIAHPNN